MITAGNEPAGNHKLKLVFIRKAKNPAAVALQFCIRTRRMLGWIQKISKAGFE
jgi:hypothetical protein